MSKTSVKGKYGKRDLSVIDIEKTLDRLEYLERRFALQDDLENDYYNLLEKAEAARRESERQIKRANDMINNSYQCECGDPKTPCPCLEGFLDNIQAILEQS